jgi:hypothetical protein
VKTLKTREIELQNSCELPNAAARIGRPLVYNGQDFPEVFHATAPSAVAIRRPGCATRPYRPG